MFPIANSLFVSLFKKKTHSIEPEHALDLIPSGTLIRKQNPKPHCMIDFILAKKNVWTSGTNFFHITYSIAKVKTDIENL